MILSVPFCPYHFVRTILSVPFCPYHFVPYHFVLEPNLRYTQTFDQRTVGQRTADHRRLVKGRLVKRTNGQAEEWSVEGVTPVRATCASVCCRVGFELQSFK